MDENNNKTQSPAPSGKTDYTKWGFYLNITSAVATVVILIIVAVSAFKFNATLNSLLSSTDSISAGVDKIAGSLSNTIDSYNINSVNESIEKTLNDLNNSIEKTLGSVNNSIEKAFNDVNNGIEKALGDVNDGIEKALGNVTNLLESIEGVANSFEGVMKLFTGDN